MITLEYGQVSFCAIFEGTAGRDEDTLLTLFFTVRQLLHPVLGFPIYTIVQRLVKYR